MSYDPTNVRPDQPQEAPKADVGAGTIGLFVLASVLGAALGLVVSTFLGYLTLDWIGGIDLTTREAIGVGALVSLVHASAVNHRA